MVNPKKAISRQVRNLRWYVTDQVFRLRRPVYDVAKELEKLRYIPAGLRGIQEAVEGIRHSVYVFAQQNAKAKSDVSRDMVRIKGESEDLYFDVNLVEEATYVDAIQPELNFELSGRYHELDGEEAKRFKQVLDKYRVKYEIEVYGE
jgi:hypothetical protein